MFECFRKKLKAKHFHFIHGWVWGVIVIGAIFLISLGAREGYFNYWFGSDFKIINAHEVIQSDKESTVLEDVMRYINIDKTVLVGAPNQVLYFDGSEGFTGYNVNNTMILKAQKDHPSRYIAFCTLNPSEPGYMEVVADCVSRGAQGFKIYTGHSFFHKDRLDDPVMFAFYDYVQKQQLPVIFHVNAVIFQEELESVLKLYPKMKVICPHFCLTSGSLQRLSYLLETYPNLYTDISFGNQKFLEEGLTRISEDPVKYKEFIEKYANRFFFGTDIIITDYEGKDADWLTQLFRIYRDLLEKDSFTTFLTGDTVFKGLNLPHETLKRIYEKNWVDFIKKTP